MVEGLLLRVYKACFGGGGEGRLWIYHTFINQMHYPIRFQFYLLS